MLSTGSEREAIHDACTYYIHSMSDPCEDTYTLSVYAVFTYVHALQSLSSALNVRGRYK